VPVQQGPFALGGDPVSRSSFARYHSPRRNTYPPTHTKPLAMSNPVVFFDMTIGGAAAGRIEMTLRADVVPKTAEVRHATAARSSADAAEASTRHLALLRVVAGGRAGLPAVTEIRRS
jgi:hypothetical protein